MLTDHEIKNLKGLSEGEARRKLEIDGFNELPSEKRKSIFTLCWNVLSEPMFVLLLACSFIYFILGDIGEAIMLCAVIFIIIGIAIYQENKTEKALSALKSLSSPRALVIRDGVQRRIAGREAVTGDLVLINEGDRVPADAVLLWSINLNIDESLLTGESMPSRKLATESERNDLIKQASENASFIFSGTLVTSGQGIAKIIKTGINTEMGKIGTMLNKIENEGTPLQKDTRKIVKDISLIGFFLCALVVVLYIFIKGEVIKGFLAGLTLAMAILPEEFPIVLTVFLALGAWRISKKKVLARKMSAIETLGSATVLCVDKTGTLTVNKMAVKKIYLPSADSVIDCHKSEMNDASKKLISYAKLASKVKPFDPMEKAIAETFLFCQGEIREEPEDFDLVREYPLSDKILSLVNVWKEQSKNHYLVAAKGAPEAISELCHLNGAEIEAVNQAVNSLALSGLRVLGVAKTYYTGDKLPAIQHDFDFEFLGLLGFADPIRPNVPSAIKECLDAGINVVMITGDYPETAKNIGRQIGLKNYSQTLSGDELRKIDDKDLVKKIEDISIFSRVMPEQKLRIVKALKAKGEIVAMTGDGVNDAPALKAAHIGIAMGERGTDVSREASSIVLLDDNFSSLVAGIKVGRRVFDNIQKAMSYIISVHIPIAGLSLFPLILKWPIVFFPVHIVFLELVVDPICSILYEAEPAEKNIMHRPPRDPKKSIFNFNLLGTSIMQGLIMMIIFLAVYRSSLILGKTLAEARAITFATLVFSNLALVLASRSKTASFMSTLKNKNSALWWIFGATLFFLSASIYLPGLNNIFGFHPLKFYDLISAFLVSLTSIIWYEAVKKKI